MVNAVLQRPFQDELGLKGWLAPLARAQRHVVRRATIAVPGWPRLPQPLRVLLMADFHVGSHTDDIARLRAIVGEAATLAPDVVLFGGDYVNMQPLGGGRVPPHVIARLLAPVIGRRGRFAILGNHDYVYGRDDVTAALQEQGISVIDYQRRNIDLGNHSVEIVGLPDSNFFDRQAQALLAGLSADRPAIVLAHDPAWFARVPAGPFLTLAGHTHGGQIKLPGIGVLKNGSRAPLRWTHGLIVENGRHLYVTAGLGTSVIPVRIGAPPEYAVLELNGPAADDAR